MVKATPERVIQQAGKWVGYVEKRSNKNQDDFSANAGKSNYTRFNRDYVSVMKGHKYPGYIGMQWCAAFVSCMFMYEFGLNAARELLCGDLHCYTPQGASYFKKAGRYSPRKKADPKPGDVVFFYSASKGRIGHVGIVYAVDSKKVYTIEGNTSGGSKLVTNGGAVWKKSYSKTSTYIDGYGRPPYDQVMVPEEAPDNWVKEYKLGDRVLKKGAVGNDVKELQEILHGWNYDLGGAGVDGDFGSKTASAVSNFQKENGLPDDGVYGAETHKKLMQVLSGETEEGNETEEEEPDDNEGDVLPDDPDQETPDADDEPEPNGDEDPLKDQDHYVVVTGETVNVRTQPNTAGKIVYVAKKDEELFYAGSTSLEGWHNVVVEGTSAWISGKYSKVVDVPDDDPKPDNDPPMKDDDDDRVVIDISMYQTISNAEMLAKNAKLVINRASIGQKKDDKWGKNGKMMRDAGIPYGVYHYVKASNVEDAVAEARTFWKAASPHKPLFYCADMEYSGIKSGNARAICSAFIGELKRLGVKRTGIYVGHHLYKKWNLDYKQVDFVWIPRYGTSKENHAGKPGKWPAYFCTLHQYTSCGKVKGIKGRVDMNRFTGKGLTYEQLIRKD